jgi:hypothetical protein
MKIRIKSYIEKLLPEPKPNSEPMLMGIASAPILQKSPCNLKTQLRQFKEVVIISLQKLLILL